MSRDTRPLRLAAAVACQVLVPALVVACSVTAFLSVVGPAWSTPSTMTGGATASIVVAGVAWALATMNAMRLSAALCCPMLGKALNR